mmetsp:Transcript_24571/g.17292  ORF Transcript_24571/g.17292 Transcript_24571/m.17292 type:complete len:111 (-) Transcript_24571:732-1064(-)|eukprot:CAMPEP_0116878810 /NCGR_PEP_ID=MMETSP0463-20121206/10566_1 /TAXON_ID=181622 /ORGANISM="Strombidinopsis sp, Strain SopsisLIS2011" /LENGTH=110 /DNA_ID=CAMNT_0004527415 /DNA_START=661 /DNA_END=993 /DNA_ORIENTATION=+
MTVAHYVPYRAVRTGVDLSDSKGASSALSTEVAVQSIHRALAGFQGPPDIFRNPSGLFRILSPCEGDVSPFDLALNWTGTDFAVMNMHFKFGLYEHMASGAIHGLIELIK